MKHHTQNKKNSNKGRAIMGMEADVGVVARIT